ncbi:phosphatidylserine decarboxylase [Bdellovibrio sp. qaytius]|nr:phosphatidylserine decarboxylase [Bdellovibrio sp. qaytius]
MKLSTQLNKNFAQYFWNSLPCIFQKNISLFLSVLYSTPISKFFISPFARRYNMSSEELLKYAPGSGGQTYRSFQDFFTRQLISPMTPDHARIYPCEGLVCESGQISEMNQVNVKGQWHTVRKIFGGFADQIPDSHFFINIFLHNHNYHRFHAPVTGVIKSLQYIPGQLNFLRPWLYAIEQVSEPAFVNERVVLEIEDEDRQSWFLTFVGGMSVGKIKLHDKILAGANLQCGEEIGLFLLGSTCCIAVPTKSKKIKFLSKVKVGDPIC